MGTAFYDRGIVGWTGTSSASGISLGAPISGLGGLAFNAGMNGQYTGYHIQHPNFLTEQEAGIALYNSGTNALTVLRRFVPSDGAGAVTFSSGTKEVRNSPIARMIVPNIAAGPPTENDDLNDGYIEGLATWYDSADNVYYRLLDHTVGAAVWAVAGIADGTIADQHLAPGTPLSIRWLDINGLPGLMPKASQAEAEAGTVTNKWMDPERVAQAIAALQSGGLWVRAAHTTATKTVSDADHQTLLELTHGAGGVSVTFSPATQPNKEGGLLKATSQAVQIFMGAAAGAGAGARYQTPDGGLSTTTFHLAGTMTWKVLQNSDGDSAIYLFEGETTRDLSLSSSVITDYRNLKPTLSGAQTLNKTNFKSGSTLINDGAAATYTIPSRLGTGVTTKSEVLVLHNRGSGTITFSASGVTIKGSANCPADHSATFEWDNDGTTEFVWIRSTG